MAHPLKEKQHIYILYMKITDKDINTNKMRKLGSSKVRLQIHEMQKKIIVS